MPEITQIVGKGNNIGTDDQDANWFYKRSKRKSAIIPSIIERTTAFELLGIDKSENDSTALTVINSANVYRYGRSRKNAAQGRAHPALLTRQVQKSE